MTLRPRCSVSCHLGNRISSGGVSRASLQTCTHFFLTPVEPAVCQSLKSSLTSRLSSFLNRPPYPRLLLGLSHLPCLTPLTRVLILFRGCPSASLYPTLTLIFKSQSRPLVFLCDSCLPNCLVGRLGLVGGGRRQEGGGRQDRGGDTCCPAKQVGPRGIYSKTFQGSDQVAPAIQLVLPEA